jgi:hypothetical protein
MQGNKQQTDNSVTKTTKMRANKKKNRLLYPTIDQWFGSNFPLNKKKTQ